MDSNAEKAHHGTLKRVIERESGSLSLLHIERDLLQSAHVKEGSVLDRREARMMQEVAVHEVAGLLSRVASDLLDRFFILVVLCVLLLYL